VTMVTTEVASDDAARYGVVQADGGRIRDYEYKPDEPKGNLVANEVFAFSPGPLLETLEDVDEPEDLGHEVLPRLVHAGGAREARFDGYWRDVGTVDAYWQCHMDLLADEPPIDLDAPGWPVLTHATGRRAAVRMRPGAEVEGSLLGPASIVSGTVERSVIGRGAVVEPGATVREAVILPGAVVRSGSSVVRAVIDDEVEVAADVGEAGGDIALVGLRERVNEPVPAGGRFPEVE
jgi:glucose-1-phosphate adenylyltransferase